MLVSAMISVSGAQEKERNGSFPGSLLIDDSLECEEISLRSYP